MSVRRSLWFLAIAGLAAASLAACGSHTSDPSAVLTPGPTPAARPGAFVWVVGYPTLVIGSANGGATWQVRHRHASDDIVSDSLFAVAFGDATHGWAVRRAAGSLVATVLTTSNAGRTWRWQYPAPKRGELLSVAATDATHAWAAGYQGDLRRNGLMIATSDGGKTWTRQRLPAGFVPLGVAFADALHGWAVADEADNDFSSNVRYCVLSTTDGGAHWRISYASGSGVTLNALTAVGPRRCWAVGYAEGRHCGLVVRTTDGGLQWSVQRPILHQNLKAVSFPDARNGWAVGSGGTVLVTHDGGASWSPQRSGVGMPLNEVSFSDPLHGWALISDRALLGTVNGGASWSVVRPMGTWNLLLGLATVDSRSGAPQ